MLEEENEPVCLSPVSAGSEEYALQYPLTKAQAEIAVKCAESIEREDVLIHAVCGAGKTELVVLSIAEMLKKRKKVCFAIPRRQVVLELRERLAQYFPHANVTAVCGGHTSVTDGDLIICTTHQLYRYYQAFDLLILDEPDAFPYKGNDVLHGIASCAVRGHTLYLTATPDEYLRERVHNGTVSELKLSVRPHGHPVPVPRIRISFVPVLLIWLIRWLKEHSSHPRMVFVPTIALAGRLYRFVSLFAECCVCTGKTENRDDVIESFRKQEHGIMICTTVLERGVTIPGADVCVWRADHGVFDEASLVQIAGRAGRSFSCPDGDVLFLCRTKSGLAQDCRSSLLEVNRCAA